MLLYNADASNILDILIELRVNRHVLGADCKPLLVLVFVCDAYYERDARRIFLHHVKHESHS